MPPQQMAESSQPVGGAFDGASEFKHRERCRDVEAAAEHLRGDVALACIRGVLGIDEADDGGQRVVGIGAASLRNIGGSSEARGYRFGSGNGDLAQLGQRVQQRRIDSGRRQRGDESGLFQFVDGFLDAVHQTVR